MFDKGLSLLCAFGMPGYKHPDGLFFIFKFIQKKKRYMSNLIDAERALKFAFLITQRLGNKWKIMLKNKNYVYILEKLNFVARVSAGVSTGQTFCVSI